MTHPRIEERREELRPIRERLDATIAALVEKGADRVDGALVSRADVLAVVAAVFDAEGEAARLAHPEAPEDEMTEVERRVAGLEPTRSLTPEESRELMSRNLDRLCAEMIEPWREDERRRIARGLRPMLLSVLPAVDDEGNAAADVADGMIDALFGEAAHHVEDADPQLRVFGKRLDEVRDALDFYAYHANPPRISWDETARSKPEDTAYRTHHEEHGDWCRPCPFESKPEDTGTPEETRRRFGLRRPFDPGWRLVLPESKPEDTETLEARLRAWIASRRGTPWSGGVSMTPEDGYNAAVEEVEAML